MIRATLGHNVQYCTTGGIQKTTRSQTTQANAICKTLSCGQRIGTMMFVVYLWQSYELLLEYSWLSN